VKLTRALGDEEIARLFEATREVLRLWTDRLQAEAGGAFPEKVTAFRPGMAVHGRYREPCPRCGAPVQRIVYARNEANYCAPCQTDGRLLAVPQKEAFPGLDFASHGLIPVEQEIYLGFVFVRLACGGPSVREMAAPYEHELAAYRFEELVPQGRVTLRPRAVNWKNVADNYSDGLHITVAHPGLTRLFGQGYGVEAQPWIDKMWGTLRDTPSAN